MYHGKWGQYLRGRPRTPEASLNLATSDERKEAQGEGEEECLSNEQIWRGFLRQRERQRERGKGKKHRNN